MADIISSIFTAEFFACLAINIVFAIAYKAISKPVKIKRYARESAAQRDARKRREAAASFEAGRALVRRVLGR